MNELTAPFSYWMIIGILFALLSSVSAGLFSLRDYHVFWSTWKATQGQFQPKGESFSFLCFENLLCLHFLVSLFVLIMSFLMLLLDVDYSTIDESALRFKIFQDSVDLVHTHNQDQQQTWTMALNQFGKPEATPKSWATELSHRDAAESAGCVFIISHLLGLFLFYLWYSVCSSSADLTSEEFEKLWFDRWPRTLSTWFLVSGSSCSITARWKKYQDWRWQFGTSRPWSCGTRCHDAQLGPHSQWREERFFFA